MHGRKIGVDCGHTLFANERVIAVVRVIGITGRCTGPITKDAEVELLREVSIQFWSRRWRIVVIVPKNSWPWRPECPELESVRVGHF